MGARVEFPNGAVGTIDEEMRWTVTGVNEGLRELMEDMLNRLYGPTIERSEYTPYLPALAATLAAAHLSGKVTDITPPPTVEGRVY